MNAFTLFRCPIRRPGDQAVDDGIGTSRLHCSRGVPTPSWRIPFLALLVLVPSLLAQQPSGPQLPPGVELPPELQAIMRQMQAADQAQAAEEDKVGTRWRGVPRIKGQAVIVYRTAVDEPDKVPRNTGQRQSEATVRFELERDLSISSPYWRARKVDLAGGVNGQANFSIGNTQTETTEDGWFRGPPRSVEEMTLSLNTADGSWQIGTPSHTRDPYTVVVRTTGQEDNGSGPVPVNDTRNLTERSVQSGLFEGTIPDEPGVVTAQFADSGNLPEYTTRRFEKRGHITFWPEFDDYALEVTIDGYADWRPLGLINAPDQPGSSLTATAVVVPKGDSPPAVVKRIRFELLDVSREPGVCLNWPLGATDRHPDLKLAVDPQSPGTLSAEDQMLEVTRPLIDSRERPYALSRIHSFDFGGRATLRVTCELLDGRELVGELKAAGDGTAQDLIRLPKMEGPDWIAAAWKNEKDAVGLPDTDDTERVDGQTYDGDGFTLYEEYRGWVVDGQRVEGDPKRKDFFVLNLIGDPATKGIALFEQLSQLRVHSRLRASEMSETKRLMNGNHRDAPQRVKQHGVWLKTFDTPEELGGTGAFTVMNKTGVAGRPGLVKGIGLLPRGHEESEFNQPHNLPRFYSLFAYDRAIAHELLHSVGVEHHGKGDGTLAAKWVSPTHRLNKIGRPYFRPMLGRNDSVLTLLTEQGHDLAAQYMASAARDREITKSFYWEMFLAEGKTYVAGRQGMDRTWATAEDYAEAMVDDSSAPWFIVPRGETGGEHSGDQDCVMRYYFAQFYGATHDDSTYYKVTEGTEPFGLQLCRKRAGTGVNAPSRQPQSRYGDAGKSGGECFSQICPNDAIPPKKL